MCLVTKHYGENVTNLSGSPVCFDLFHSLLRQGKIPLSTLSALKWILDWFQAVPGLAN